MSYKCGTTSRPGSMACGGVDGNMHVGKSTVTVHFGALTASIRLGLPLCTSTCPTRLPETSFTFHSFRRIVARANASSFFIGGLDFPDSTERAAFAQQAITQIQHLLELHRSNSLLSNPFPQPSSPSFLTSSSQWTTRRHRLTTNKKWTICNTPKRHSKPPRKPHKRIKVGPTTPSIGVVFSPVNRNQGLNPLCSPELRNNIPSVEGTQMMYVFVGSKSVRLSSPVSPLHPPNKVSNRKACDTARLFGMVRMLAYPMARHQ